LELLNSLHFHDSPFAASLSHAVGSVLCILTLLFTLWLLARFHPLLLVLRLRSRPSLHFISVTSCALTPAHAGVLGATQRWSILTRSRSPTKATTIVAGSGLPGLVPSRCSCSSCQLCCASNHTALSHKTALSYETAPIGAVFRHGQLSAPCCCSCSLLWLRCINSHVVRYKTTPTGIVFRRGQLSTPCRCSCSSFWLCCTNSHAAIVTKLHPLVLCSDMVSCLLLAVAPARCSGSAVPTATLL